MSPRKPLSLPDVKHFAKVSRSVILRRMSPDRCFDDRVFWALVLWSWCGPEKTEDGMVVRKDARGYIERDKSGRPLPAQQKDLIGLLDLKDGLKGEISRVMARLNESGQVWTDEAGLMYVDPEPPAFESSESVANTRNWKIADRIITTADLPADPVASTAAIERLEELSTAWKNDLKALRTRYRLLAIQAVSGGAISIDREVREEEKQASKQACLPAPSPDSRIPAPEPEEPAPPSPLADGLAEIFPQNLLREEAVERLDEHLEAALGEYPPGDFVAFVRQRMSEGRIGPGLVFDLENGLARDYIALSKKINGNGKPKPVESPPPSEPPPSNNEDKRRDEWARAILRDDNAPKSDREAALAWLGAEP